LDHAVAKDPYRYFRIEARELIDGLAAGVLALEKGGGPPSCAQLLRLAHTLKGAARVVRQGAIADLAHALEDVLDPLRSQSQAPPAGTIDACLQLIDRMRSGLATIATAPAGEQAEAAARSMAAGPGPGPAHAPGQGPGDEALRSVRIATAETDGLVDDITAVGHSLADVHQELSGLEACCALARALGDRLERDSALRGGGGPGAALALAQELAERLQRSRRGLIARVESAQRELVEIRARGERLRLVPAAQLFAPLERVVRDAARALGCEAAFLPEGGDIGIDAAVHDALLEALPHVVRNAVAHGIEPPDVRVRSGKPRQGTVRLQVARLGCQVMISCTDDGRGIDLPAITAAAVARGLAPAGRQLDEAAAIAVLLRGGLSTSATVSGISGRGVGLDVVRATVERLGGRLALRTGSGQGATVELLVPVSLASLPALVAEAGGVAVAIPLEAVQRTLRVDQAAVVRSPGGDVIRDDQRTLSVLPLAVLLGSSADQRAAAGPLTVVVLQAGDQRAALVVGRLRGTSAVTVRPLPAGVERVPFIAGAGVDDAGVAQLVLEAGEAIRAVNGWGASPAAAPPPRRLPILVIDDSLTTRTLEQSILESAGYEVDVATSGEEGMAMADARSYGLFMVDVEMPGMDGYTFVERTRADPRLAAVPAILITSRDAAEDRRRGLEAGAMAYIIKSEFDQGRLLALIRGALE
jgi:two-component system chemotaxis sensor kinase CheA